MTDATSEAERNEARSPETSIDRLVALADLHIEEVLQNPAFDLVLLEVPDFWAKLRTSTLVDLAKSPRCPRQFVEWAMRGRRMEWSVRGELAMNPALPVEKRRIIFLNEPNDVPRWFRRRSLLSQLLSEADLSLLGRAGMTLHDKRRHRDADLTDADFDRLATMGKLGRQLALNHPGCPRVLLDRLLDDPMLYSRPAQLLRNPNLPAARLVRFLVSEHKEDELEILELLSLETTPTPWSRILAASHPSLPIEWFERLAHDPEPVMRAAIASNPSLPSSVRAVIEDDPTQEVRKALASNQSLAKP